MKIEFDKTMMIASELLSYCHIMEAAEYHLDIKIANGETTFEIKASPARMSADDLELLRNKLNAPRQREIEQDYWLLSGETGASSELILIGRMTDKAIVEYADEMLSIKLTRVMNE